MKQAFLGRHVVVTGAGAGIGQATALEVAARGARVSVVDIDRAAAEATTAAIGARGGSARAYVVDVASASEVETFAGAVVLDAGPVDVLVNNAGVAVVAPFHRTASSQTPASLAEASRPRRPRPREGRMVVEASHARHRI